MRADECSRPGYGHVVLPDVYAVSVYFNGQLHVVVDNERHAHAAQVGLQGEHLLALLLVIELLRAVLHNRHAALNGAAYRFDQAIATAFRFIRHQIERVISRVHQLKSGVE